MNKGFLYRTTGYYTTKFIERNIVILHQIRLSKRGIKKILREEIFKDHKRKFFHLKLTIHEQNQINPNGGMWDE